MTQKELVADFLIGKETLSPKVLWDMFNEEQPTFKKSNFDFYRNQILKNVTIEGTGIAIRPTVLNKVFQDETIDLCTINPNQFISNVTGTAFDTIASKRGGIMPGTTYIITGESGAGKTTICTNIADYLMQINPELKAGFISCEMDRNDWIEECLDNNRLCNLNTIFMLDYLDAPNYLEVLIEGLTRYDFCILDSFEVVIDQLREIKGWTAKKAESELINILRKAATSSNTTIFAIQQYTKGGNFVGSNKIKHMLTGMAFVLFDERGDRYITFTKNRRCGHMVNKRLYFTKNKETGRIEFNQAKLDNELAFNKFASDEETKRLQEEALFEMEILGRAKEKQERRENLITSVGFTHGVTETTTDVTDIEVTTTEE